MLPLFVFKWYVKPLVASCWQLDILPVFKYSEDISKWKLVNYPLALAVMEAIRQEWGDTAGKIITILCHNRYRGFLTAKHYWFMSSKIKHLPWSGGSMYGGTFGIPHSRMLCISLMIQHIIQRDDVKLFKMLMPASGYHGLEIHMKHWCSIGQTKKIKQLYIRGESNDMQHIMFSTSSYVQINYCSLMSRISP